MTSWDRVVGQEAVRERLRRDADRPVHAYLLVGARGSGVEDAARWFAAVLVASGDERAEDLARRGMHPDIAEFEPEGVGYRVHEDVRARIIPEASRSPVEGARKVIVIHEAERLGANRGEAANALLKTIEEPPPRTVVVLVTSSPDELPETVRSRCRQVDLAPLTDAAVQEALVREGIAPESAALATRLAGGQLGRARALAGPDRELRDAFVAAAAALDGRAGSAMRQADVLGAVLKANVAALEARQRAEAASLAAELDAAGYPERAAAVLVARLEERHQRERRRARRHALAEGIAALETCYRDVLAGLDAPRRNLDRPLLPVSPAAAAAALEACRVARVALERNPNEALLLERLLLALPAVAGGSSS